MKQKIFQALWLALGAFFLISIVPCFAWGADAGTLEIVQEDETTVHEFMAQQIIAAEVTDGAIINPNQGNGVTEGFWTELEKTEGYPKEASTVQDIAEWIAENIQGEQYRSFVVMLATSARAFPGAHVSTVKAGASISLEPGYYVISSETAEPFVATIEAGKTTTIHEKSTTPTVTKQVLDENGTEVKIKEASIGKPMTFRLTGTLPTNYNSFPEYYYEFIDLPDGSFTFDLNAIKVSLHSEGKVEKDVTAAFTVSEDTNTGNVSLICSDLKKVLPSDDGSTKVIAEYKASLNEEATPGLDAPNINKASLKYYATPLSKEWGVADENIINPQATIFTYDTVINKVSSLDPSKKLSGAGFVIKSDDGRYFNGKSWSTSQHVFLTGEDGRVVIKGLDHCSNTAFGLDAAFVVKKSSSRSLIAA